MSCSYILSGAVSNVLMDPAYRLPKAPMRIIRSTCDRTRNCQVVRSKPRIISANKRYKREGTAMSPQPNISHISFSRCRVTLEIDPLTHWYPPRLTSSRSLCLVLLSTTAYFFLSPLSCQHNLFLFLILFFTSETLCQFDSQTSPALRSNNGRRFDTSGSGLCRQTCPASTTELQCHGFLCYSYDCFLLHHVYSHSSQKALRWSRCLAQTKYRHSDLPVMICPHLELDIGLTV